MSSLSNNNTVSKSMNGLIVIDADAVTSSEIDVDTLIINISGTAPTIANPLDYSDNIATTEWVTNHAGVGYVTINTSQTLTAGTKTFTNLPECATTATTNNQMVNLNTLTNAISTAGSYYVTLAGTQTNISGEKTFTNANTYINNTLTANTITATGDLTLNPVGSINCNGKTIDMTGGEIHKCPLIHSQNNNNIVVEALGTGDIILKTNGINRVTVADSGITTFSTLPECATTATTNNQLVNLNTLNSAISTAGGSYVTIAGAPQLITGDKTFNGSIDFLSLEVSSISNTGSIDTPNIGSGLATDPISIVPSQSSGTCNIATFATRSGTINLGTGSSSKILNIGGTGTTTNINSSTTTINTSTTSGNGITHSSTATSGDDMRLTATGGYLARLGEGSSSAGLTLLGIDSGTSIIKATTSALEIRADAGLTFTGTIGSNNTFSGTNTYTGTSSFQNNVTVQAGNTCRYGSRSVGSPSGIDLGQTNTNEISLKLVTTADDFYFRTSANANMMAFGNAGIGVYYPFAMSANFTINQSTYPSTTTTQLGYTITKTFGPSILGDTTGTFTQVGTTGQALGTNTGVYLITCGFELTNSGSDTVNNKALCLSLSSASGTPVNSNGAWEYYEEINDSMGSAGTRYKGTLCGVYIKTTTSAQTLYLNGYANTSGSQTISATGNCSITRIG